MYRTMVLVVAAMLLWTAVPAFAELENVVVGGAIRIRGNLYTGPGVGDTGGLAPGLRWPAWSVWGRPIGNAGGVSSLFSWDDSNNNWSFVEERTRLNVAASFTDSVKAVIELDSYDTWGQDFRSNYVTGLDGRAASVDDVEIYQSYIEAADMFGMPLTARIGRQEIALGSQWLVGVNDASSVFTGLSFDAIRLTYACDDFSVDAIASKLAETSPLEEDGDVDFYALYGSYLGIEDVTLDAYWMLVRDARALGDVVSGPLGNWFEDALDVDDYPVTTLHTVGLRGAGTFGAFDLQAEAAAQFGDAAAVGAMFRPVIFGDDDAQYNEWGANLETGYTFDAKCTPRVYVGGAYFSGDDNRDFDVGEWLDAALNPFHKPSASVSFNRLFSNWEYSEFIETTDLSNCWIARAGMSAMATEDVKVLLAGTYFVADEPFSPPASV
ncbi:MAG: Alginate export family protein, partial [Candidatus Hydrogenedentes bacterium]|nr:Alginate export family protein [Candidatus Hydrogenedentota bacterium]